MKTIHVDIPEKLGAEIEKYMLIKNNRIITISDATYAVFMVYQLHDRGLISDSSGNFCCDYSADQADDEVFDRIFYDKAQRKIY